jgi:hypothetical protein
LQQQEQHYTQILLKAQMQGQLDVGYFQFLIFLVVDILQAIEGKG